MSALSLPFSRRCALLCVGAALLAAACSKTDGPEEPVWGKEPCAHCRMLVGDKRYAAQALEDGERRFFDDAGCLVLWLDSHGGASTRAWVRDADSGQWLDARSATYAGGKRTPMDFGFEAHAEGVGLAFAAMRDAVRAKNGAKR